MTRSRRRLPRFPNPAHAMAENAQPAGAGAGDTSGVPYYEKSRQQLKELLQKRRNLERQLVGSPPLLVRRRRDGARRGRPC